MMKKKHTKLQISQLDILTNDPSFPGTYPIDESPESDILIGLIDSPDTPPPAPAPPVVSKEPDAKVLTPFPDRFGDQTRPTSAAYPRDAEIPGTPATVTFEQFLPEIMRKGRDNKSLLEPFIYNAMDNWISPPDLDNVGGYVGEVIENGIITENYITEDSEFALENQIQPSIRSFIDGNNTNLNMTWQELLDAMRLIGLDVDNKSDKFFATTKYSYQPPINPDKFVNFRYWYWIKSLGRWDMALNPANEFELILTNGSFLGITDLNVGDIIRVNSGSFTVTAVDAFTPSLTVIDTSESIFLEPFTRLTQSLVGHDRPLYNVQAESEYISNSWIDDNYWVHLDDFTIGQVEGFTSGAFVRAQLPIIELLADVVIDTDTTYIKGQPPNVLLYPLQYVDISRSGVPVNIENNLVGYDPITELPIYEQRTGTIPVIKQPVLEYRQDEFHLDGEPTEIDPILGFKAVKSTKDGGNYIFKNGLIDNTSVDIRNGRFYVYLTQVAVEDLEQAFEFVQTLPSDTWLISHGLDYIPIVRVFLTSGEEILPVKIESTTTDTTIYFSSPVSGNARLV